MIYLGPFQLYKPDAMVNKPRECSYPWWPSGVAVIVLSRLGSVTKVHHLVRKFGTRRQCTVKEELGVEGRPRCIESTKIHLWRSRQMIVCLDHVGELSNGHRACGQSEGHTFCGCTYVSSFLWVTSDGVLSLTVRDTPKWRRLAMRLLMRGKCRRRAD
jgi:hypothetical protein